MESSRASATYQVAVTYVGARAFGKVYVEYMDSNPEVVSTTAGFKRFKVKAKRILDEARSEAREISVTHAKLQRAIWTGTTFGVPGKTVKLSDLRSDFHGVIKTSAPSAFKTNVIPDMTPSDGIDDSRTVEVASGKYVPYSLDDFADDAKIRVGKIDGMDDEVGKADADIDREFDDVLDSAFARFNDAKASVSDNHKKKARNIAGNVERMTHNASRAYDFAVAHNDEKVIGYARVHIPEDDIYPCGFCALLLSRGVFYKSARTANLTGSDFDEFHSKCHCHAAVIYDMDFYNSDDRFEPNRRFTELWNSKFKGKYTSASAAMTAWRAEMKRLKSKAEAKAK